VAASPDWNPHDERPAQAKGAYSFHDADQASLPPSNRRASGAEEPAASARAARAPAAASDAGPAPPGFPADLPAPEALSAADAKNAAPLGELVGDYLSRCLYSRTWQLREAALARLAKDLEAGKVEALGSSSGACSAAHCAAATCAAACLPSCVRGPRRWFAAEPLLQCSRHPLKSFSCPADGVRVIAGAVLRALKDKVAAVYGAALAALRALVAAQASSCPPRELQAALAELLPVLAEKAAELNQRTREQAVETLLALATVPEAGLRSATATFLRAPKPGTAWKAVLGRWELFELDTTCLRLQCHAAGDCRLHSQAHSCSALRTCRLQLVSALLPVVGIAPEGSSEGFALAPLMAFVGQALSNSSAEVRAAAIALTVRVAQLAGPAVQRLLPADLNPKVKEQIEQGMLSSASSPAPPKPAAPAPAKTPPSKQQAAASGGKPAAQRQQQAAAPSPPVQQQQQQQPSPAETDDEAARYEAEVRAREARLGPSHPDVAEAVCNLAILYNQVSAAEGGNAGCWCMYCKRSWLSCLCHTPPLLFSATQHQAVPHLTAHCPPPSLPTSLVCAARRRSPGAAAV
jgi:centrosomal protein CEP104